MFLSFFAFIDILFILRATLVDLFRHCRCADIELKPPAADIFSFILPDYYAMLAIAAYFHYRFLSIDISLSFFAASTAMMPPRYASRLFHDIIIALRLLPAIALMAITPRGI